jgi:hypothetical protein
MLINLLYCQQILPFLNSSRNPCLQAIGFVNRRSGVQSSQPAPSNASRIGASPGSGAGGSLNPGPPAMVTSRITIDRALSANCGGFFKTASLGKEESAGALREFGTAHELGHSKTKIRTDQTAAGSRPCRDTELFRDLWWCALDHGRAGFRA